ncbi:TetR/AcrR family transcriptional regulator C-terminal domain-containing protein [Paenarthrobacter sp. NPDC089322]|uniref:TetR/AcrR family transcriptional regulator n=1 Tax=Paenarthrobacter sp. NPDC089322 TaxID=3155065 RepID=UPI003428277F
MATVQKTSRNGQSPLTKGKILDAAVTIVDEQGLQALTIRKVADALGVYPTAINWHIGSKDQLVADASGLIFEALQLPDDKAHDWRDWLRLTAVGFRESMHSHPNFAVVIGNQLHSSLPALPFVERVLRILNDKGLKGAALLKAYNAYVGCLIGWVSLELSTRGAAAPHGEDQLGVLNKLDERLYTALTRNLPVVANKAFMVRWDTGTTNPMDDSFDFMLEAVLAGIAESIKQSTPQD